VESAVRVAVIAVWALTESTLTVKISSNNKQCFINLL